MLAPFLLRVTLGVVFIVWAYKHLKSHEHPKWVTLGAVDGVMGVLLVIGLYTQLVALISALFLTIGLISKAFKKSLFTGGVNYYFILFIIAVSLLFLGAGAFAVDLPL